MFTFQRIHKPKHDLNIVSVGIKTRTKMQVQMTPSMVTHRIASPLGIVFSYSDFFQCRPKLQANPKLDHSPCLTVAFRTSSQPNTHHMPKSQITWLHAVVFLKLLQMLCRRPSIDLSISSLMLSSITHSMMNFQLQGSIMVASLFEVFIGLSGLMGFMLKFIGPIVITPTITLIGLSLFSVATEAAGSQWAISFA